MVLFAGVMELADVLDSKSSGSDTVPVRPRSPAPLKLRQSETDIKSLQTTASEASLSVPRSPAPRKRLAKKASLFLMKSP